ncbi:LamG domain-containing protein [Thalassotalea sp. 1_MG-2023]|uniref:LamG domain-containing protein n=1 Tax=Thalassotalea sp. 1_MG-2023 TaxID=3062680 RepID=UPI0026E31523|nr:LamG domain-containing protein [Thalassotalea sp. 1_MG-2023]MDO6426305.1 LamG domain-containing protein [Thalassotalea sp. 1_MG-2023]
MYIKVFAATILFCCSVVANAIDCSEIFPQQDHSFAVNGSKQFFSYGDDSECNSNKCKTVSIPTFTPPALSGLPDNGAFNLTTVTDGVYYYSSWGLTDSEGLTFSGTGTAVIYIDGNATIPVGSEVNLSGVPSNILIVVTGALTIADDVKINANIYVAGSTVIGSLGGNDFDINGAISVGGALAVYGEGELEFDAEDITDMNTHGLCVNAKPFDFSCNSTFVDGITSHTNNGQIHFNRDSKIINNPDNILATARIIHSSNITSCDVFGQCSASGTPTTAMTSSRFKTTSSSQDFSVSRNSTRTINGNTFDEVAIERGGTLNFSSNYSEYRIETLSLKTDATLRLTPGDYWIEELTYSGFAINIEVIGSGLVRMFFKDGDGNNDALELPRNTTINQGGNASEFHIYAYQGVKLNRNANVTALLYAVEDIEIERSTTFQGAISGDNIELNRDSFVTYSCGATAQPTEVLHLKMEEATWQGGSGLVIDSINGINGTAYNGAKTVGSASCRYGEFDGNNDHVLIPHNDLLNGTSTLTYAAYFRANSWNGTTQIMAKSVHGGGSGRAQMGIFSENGVLKGRAETANGRYEITSSLPATLGDWVHVALVFNGTSLKLYQDGAVVASSSFSATTLVQTNDPLAISKRVGTNQYFFHGLIDDIHVFQNALSAAEVQTLIDNNPSCPLTDVDHYLITHSGTGLTCEPEPITIKACTNSFGANCVESSNIVNVDLVATGSSHAVTQSVSFIGSTTVDLPYQVAEKTTLSIDNASIPASNGYVCNSNNPNDCDITFSNAGFKITGFNNIEIAGEAMLSAGNSRIFIQAVKNNKGACQGYFDTPGARNIDFAMKAITPSTINGTQNYLIGNNVVPKYSGSSPNQFSTVSLTFDANSQAQLPNNLYHDVGDIALYAKHTIPATVDNPAITLVGDSDVFYVRPYAFLISASTSSGNSLDNTSDTGGSIQKAGEAFNLSMKAVNKSGGVTKNFNKNVELALQRTAPFSEGAEGVLVAKSVLGLVSNTLAENYTGVTVPFSQGEYQSEVDYNQGATYSEVGLIKLFAREVQNANNNNNHAQGQSAIGRFVPAQFAMVSSVPAQFAMVSNDVENFCNAMTYMSQPAIKFNYRIEAQNAAGVKTENYLKTNNFDFIKANIAFVAENANTIDLSTRLADFNGNWQSGVYENEDDSSGKDEGKFNRLTSIDGPYEQLRYGIKLVDPEGSELLGLDMLSNAGNFTAKALSSSASKMRFGRWVVDNAYGPETEALPVAMRLEYFDGSGFVVHDDDSCTTPTLNTLNDKVITGAIFSGGLVDGQYRLFDMDNTDGLTMSDVDAATAGSFAAGRFIDQPNRFTFSAPGNGKQGALQFEYEVPEWLKYDWQDDGNNNDNPAALLNFGLFRGNDRIISWREIQK